MKFEFPQAMTGNTREDVNQLWRNYWSCVEKLNLLMEQIDGLGRQIAGATERTGASQAATRIPANLRAARIPFGTVDPASEGTTATDIRATVPGVTALTDGVCAYIMNGVATSASGWTLNVNGLGAKPVYQTLAAATRSSTIFNVAYTMLFVYNETRVAGGCWDVFYGYNSDTNTLAYNIRDYNAAKLAASAIYRYMFVFTGWDGKLVPSCGTSNSTATSKTLSTTSFDPFGPIYYYSTTTTVDAGNSPSASYLYRAYSSANMRYAFNVASTQLTAKAPVFVRCSPQTDGSVKLDGNNCIAQALPTSADGKVYIRLGFAYSAYQVELCEQHPVYHYENGAIRLWTGP